MVLDRGIQGRLIPPLLPLEPISKRPLLPNIIKTGVPHCDAGRAFGPARNNELRD